MDPGWGQRDVGWAALLILFAASLLTVFGWLLQYARGLWLARARRGRGRGPALAAEPAGSLRELGVWRSLLRLRATRAGAAEEPGVRGLLASLFAFKSFRENWQRAWVRALNEQACRDGVSWTGAPTWSAHSAFAFRGGTAHARKPDGGGDQLGNPHGFSSPTGSEKRVQVRLEVAEIPLCPKSSILVVRVLFGSKPMHKLLFS